MVEQLDFKNETKIDFPFFDGIPYQNNKVLKSEDFDNACERNEKVVFKKGAGKKHLVLGKVAIAVGAVVAGASAVGAAVAGGAASAATAVGTGIAGAGAAVGRGIAQGAEEGFEAWKDGASEILHKIKPH